MGRRLTRRRFLRAGGLALAAGYALGARFSVPRAVAAASPATYAVPGLSAPGEILVDRWGIPHLYAASRPDVFFLQGFNAARDRLWQIDLWRRRGLGRLSAAFGPSYLEQDRAARLFLYRGDIATEWRAYGEDAEAIATALHLRASTPASTSSSAASPRCRWSSRRSATRRSAGRPRTSCASAATAWSTTWRARSRAPSCCATSGPRRRRCAGASSRRGSFRCPTGSTSASSPTASSTSTTSPPRPSSSPPRRTRRGRRAPPRRPPAPAAGAIGSNNWAISPERTVTGRPILANDPHRTQGVPSLRYLAHLVAPGLDVIGAGEPALPGISIGHNGSIAFGLTIFAIDQEDLYVYETRPGSPQEYRYGDGWEAMRVVQEAVPVHGAPGRDLDAALHAPRAGRRRGRGETLGVRAALRVVRARHVGVLRVDRLHGRGHLGRVPVRPAPLGRARARTRSTPTGRATSAGSRAA